MSWSFLPGWPQRALSAQVTHSSLPSRDAQTWGLRLDSCPPPSWGRSRVHQSSPVSPLPQPPATTPCRHPHLEPQDSRGETKSFRPLRCCSRRQSGRERHSWFSVSSPDQLTCPCSPGPRPTPTPCTHSVLTCVCTFGAAATASPHSLPLYHFKLLSFSPWRGQDPAPKKPVEMSNVILKVLPLTLRNK